MANTWESLQMTITKNNSTKVAHYETDTANIVDFEEASNNLINAALNAFANNTVLRGTTTINSLKTPNPINISNDGGIYIRDSEDFNKINGHIYTDSDYLIKMVAGSAASGDGNQCTGAGIVLEKIPDEGSGKFTLFAAKNKSTRISLIGDPQTGKLTWNGKELVDKSMLENNDFKKMILNLIYPVGSVIYTATSTLPGNIGSLGGTWKQIAQGRVIVGVGSGTDSNGTSKSFSAGNNTGEYTHKLVTNELASHGHGSGGTITTSASGDHVHSRGDMNITGWFGCDDKTTTTYGGAFYDGGWGYDTGAQRSETGNIFRFDASRAWTGYTSVPLSNDKKHKEIANHTHTVSISLSETGGNAYHNNVQPSYGLYIWQRTA